MFNSLIQCMSSHAIRLGHMLYAFPTFSFKFDDCGLMIKASVRLPDGGYASADVVMQKSCSYEDRFPEKEVIDNVIQCLNRLQEIVNKKP